MLLFITMYFSIVYWHIIITRMLVKNEKTIELYVNRTERTGNNP